jgi:GlpG protein
MSGVVYGLFGYLWMKSRYEPGSGFYVTQNTVVWMVGWFLMCLFGVIPGVANAVHAAGFLVGIIVGRWPSLWRSFR